MGIRPRAGNMRDSWKFGVLALALAAGCGSEDGGRDGSVGWQPTSASATATMPTSAGGSEETGKADDPDDGGGTSGGSNITTPTTDPTTATAPTTDPTTMGTMDPTAGETGDPSVTEQCLEIAQNECEACGCNMCIDTLLACQLDAGCVAIRDCAVASGCQTVLDCYNACEGVINQNGGALGDSAELAGELSECMEASCVQACAT